MKILVTGSNGFLGKNLIESLKLNDQNQILNFDLDNTIEELKEYTKACDFVFHLAGVNRPTDPKDFYLGNAGLTETLCNFLFEEKNKAPIVITSSIQAILDNDYGKSKKEGENIVLNHGIKNDSNVYVYRLANLFGKWSKPNYNSVIATWCHNIANNLEISMNNPEAILSLSYVDDVVEEFNNALMGKPNQKENFCFVEEVYEMTLQRIFNLITSFKNSRENKEIIKTGDSFVGKLYATYLSYLNPKDFKYPLKMNVDNRGSFTEFLKTSEYGQVSINISKPGIVKGNHWHNTKNEKFLVVSGSGVIRFRNIDSSKIIEYFVSGELLEVVDIPTGYTHNIENLGNNDMVTIMWASEQFDAKKPDTIFLEV